MKKNAAAAKKASAPKTVVPKYPRHSLEKVLRIPKAILDQNVGKECSDEDTATFLGIKYNKGPYALELSSALKFGLLERPSAGRIAISELAKKILRPQNEQEELVGLREAVLKAPDISTVYSHYRGENLPDMQFFDNALVDKFDIPKDKVAEFKTIFFDTLNKAKLIEEHNGKQAVARRFGRRARYARIIRRAEEAWEIRDARCWGLLLRHDAIRSPTRELLRESLDPPSRRQASNQSVPTQRSSAPARSWTRYGRE